MPAEYVTLISGQSDAPEVRCGLTDGHTHRLTNPTTVTLAAHVRRKVNENSVQGTAHSGDCALPAFYRLQQLLRWGETIL